MKKNFIFTRIYPFRIIILRRIRMYSSEIYSFSNKRWLMDGIIPPPPPPPGHFRFHIAMNFHGYLTFESRKWHFFSSIATTLSNFFFPIFFSPTFLLSNYLVVHLLLFLIFFVNFLFFFLLPSLFFFSFELRNLFVPRRIQLSAIRES